MAPITPLRYVFDDTGGFIAGNFETGVISYAYPTSTHARNAKKAPRKVAYLMTSTWDTETVHRLWIETCPGAPEDCARLWKKLNVLVGGA